MSPRAPVARALVGTLLALSAAAALPATSGAQTLSQRAAEAASTLSFREIGPSVMGGRVSDLAVVESDPRIFYVGLGAGGLWKTTNDGMTWEPVFDDQPTASIGAVALAPSNPNVVWVGTGEPQNRQSSPWGMGVFRSIDAGRSWSHVGLEDTKHVARIVVHPADPDVAYVAAVGHLWGPNAERGVFRTTDGGATWEKILYVDEHTGAIDLVMDHGDPRTLFAATYQRRRTGFGFAAGGGGSGIWRTMDGGDSWSRLEKGLPPGELGRIGLDVYRRDGSLVYAVVEAREGSGVYRSTDRGESWEKMSDRNPRPMYFSLIRIDPNNPERIYLGGVQMSASDDGGRTWWEGNATDDIHSDHHSFWIDPNDSNHLLDGNDGGVATSRDGSKTWRAYTNMAIGQFYEIGVDMGDPYRVCGGLQDNGNWCAPHRTQINWGLRDGDWTHVWFGDGFYNQIDPTNPDIMYSESQGGNIARIHVPSLEAQSLRPVARPLGTEAEDDEPRAYRFNWNSPIVVSRHDPATIYIGGNHLLRSRDRGMNWEEAGPDLTRQIDRDTLSIMGRRVDDETLSGHDGISSYGNITAIAESRHSRDVIYVGTDDGNLQVTRDGGATWTNVIDRVPGVPPRTYVSRIETSHAVDGRVYVTFDGHRNDDYAPYAYASEDFGRSWRPIVDGLPHGWSVNVIREHPGNPDLLVLGNEVGAWISIDRGVSWGRLESNLPTVPVDDIVIHPRENDLLLGTHGRSIWILDDMTPLEELTREVLVADAQLFSSRRSTMWSMGMGWPFQPAAFIADNPPEGVMIRYYLREAMDAEPVVASAGRGGSAGPAANAREDGRALRPSPGGSGGNGAPRGQAARTDAGEAPLTLEILDSSGEVIRSLDPVNEAGIQQVVWDFRIEPPFEAEPSRGFGGFGGGGARGPLVLPGTYTARLTAGEVVQTTELEVRLDPRVQASREDLIARHEASMGAYGMAKPLRDANRRLGAMARRVGELERLIRSSDVEDATKEALGSEAKAVADEIEEVEKALDRANRMGRSTFGIERWSGRPTADQVWSIDTTWDAVPPVIERVNALLTERMPALETRLVEAGIRPDLGDPVEVPRRR